MARKARGKASSKRSVDFSNVGKPFEKDMDVHLVVKAATWEDGNAGDYIAIEFCGKDEEYENSSIYHNASFAPKALPRTRALLEAMGYEIDGEVEIDTDDLVGLEVMATTYEDRYDGGKSIKADEFWPAEAEVKESKSSKGVRGGTRGKNKADDDKPAKGKTAGKAKGKAKAEPEVEELDLDEIPDKDIKAIGKALKIKTKDADEIRAELADVDEDDIREAAAELEIELPGGEEEEAAPAKGKARGKASAGGSKAKSGGKSKKAATWSSDDIMEMSEEELEEVIEQADIEVDLDEHKTLRKKKNAVIDALTEADLLDE